MKKGISLLLFVLVILSVSAQSTDKPKTEKADTIVQLGGRKLIVYIKNVSSSKISYKKPNNSELFSIDRNLVRRVTYHDGRKEEFNPPLFKEVDKDNWKTVIVTDLVSDVDGLYPQGKVQGKSSNVSRNAKAAKRSATIRVQKKAANLGAQYVYVTKRESKGGYGEIPSYVIEGVAYSFTPKKEKEDEKQIEQSTRK